MNYCKNQNIKCDPDCVVESIAIKCDKTSRSEVSSVTGLEYLRSSKHTKGLCFTTEERKFLGIHGLLPAAVRTPEEQLQHCVKQVSALKKPLDKYNCLMNLAEREQRMFFRLIASDIESYLPIIYIPTLEDACRDFCLIHHHPRGLFIGINDKGHIYDILKNWQENYVQTIVVTDGESALGLGDLGAYAMGLSISNSMLFTAMAGINPQKCLAIMLDCGTNKNSLIIDPLYIGIREERITGTCYDEFMDEFMNAVVHRFGPTCLIQFKGFGTENAVRLLARYGKNFCTFNDDIQATASMVLAGILVAMKSSGKQLKSQKILFFGAGGVALGIAKLLYYALLRHGVHNIVAKRLIWLFDTKGLIVRDRPAGGITSEKFEFARVGKPMDNFLEVLEYVRPSILIGASTCAGAFTPEILKLMADFHERPIIFALSNPANRAECTAKEAYTHTNGKCYFSAGSPCQPLYFKSKQYFPSQCNSAAIFPGIALGVMCAGMRYIPQEIFFIAAENLAEMITQEELSKGLLFPSLNRIMCCSLEIAKWVMEYAYRFDLGTVMPEPKNKIEFIKMQLYDLDYPTVIPEIYFKDEML